MDKQSYDPAELAHKWKRGTISAEELAWFEEWYADFNDEELLFYTSKYTSATELKDGMFNRLSAKLDQQVSQRGKVYSLWRNIAAAAAVIFIIGLAAFFYFPSQRVIQLTKPIVWNTRPGQHRQIRLPDGTKVWLSPSTRISYPSVFGEKKREVALAGEAFFEVVHDADHPFVINSGHIRTVVLGTSFNVRAYPKHVQEEVTVVSGKVGVLQDNGDKQAQVTTAFQRVVFDQATGRFAKSACPDAARFLEQRNGLFKFDDASLTTILKELELQYGTQIIAAPDLSAKAFYGNINTNLPLEQTLDKLCTIMEMQRTLKNGIYYLQANETINH